MILLCVRMLKFICALLWWVVFLQHHRMSCHALQTKSSVGLSFQDSTEVPSRKTMGTKIVGKRYSLDRPVSCLSWWLHIPNIMNHVFDKLSVPSNRKFPSQYHDRCNNVWPHDSDSFGGTLPPSLLRAQFHVQRPGECLVSPVSLLFWFSALLPGVSASSAAAKEAQLGWQDLVCQWGASSLNYTIGFWVMSCWIAGSVLMHPSFATAHIVISQHLWFRVISGPGCKNRVIWFSDFL